MIEHGQLIDDKTARLMAKKGVWLSVQAFIDNEFVNPQSGEARVKQQLVQAGTDRAIAMAKKHKIKMAWGTDILFNPRAPKHQGAMLATMSRWFSAPEVLRMATSTNAQLLALSGPRNPYQGQLGVVKQGALADLLLVAGNPLEDLSLIADPQRNFVVIMKDGKVYKDQSH